MALDCSILKKNKFLKFFLMYLFSTLVVCQCSIPYFELENNKGKYYETNRTINERMNITKIRNQELLEG